MPSKKPLDKRGFPPCNGNTTCEECGKTLASPWGLEAHLKYVHGEKVFQCEFCEKAFARKDHLINHERSIHTGLKQCPHCSKIFSRERLSDHLITVHGSTTTPSSLNPIKFLSSQLSTPTSTGLLCKLCGQEFSSKYRLKQHIILTHTEGVVPLSGAQPTPPPKPPQPTVIKEEEQTPTLLRPARRVFCPICKTLHFDSPDKLMKHMHAKHPLQAQNLEILYKCQYCSGTFTREASLDSHIASFHGEQRCLICGSSFSGFSEISDHLRECHGPRKSVVKNKIIYSCDCCGESFGHPVQYEDHVISRHSWSNVKIHKKNSSDLLLVCDFCDHLFINKAHKEEHIKEYHPFKEQSRLKFSCEFCPSIFDSCERLEVHTKEGHFQNVPPPSAPTPPSEPENEKFRRFILQSEQLFASSMNSLKEEEKKSSMDTRVCSPTVESREQNKNVLYQCNQCSDSFQDSDALNKHVTATHSTAINNNNLSNGNRKRPLCESPNNGQSPKKPYIFNGGGKVDESLVNNSTGVRYVVAPNI